jgi:hypothetical protein
VIKFPLPLGEGKGEGLVREQTKTMHLREMSSVRANSSLAINQVLAGRAKPSSPTPSPNGRREKTKSDRTSKELNYEKNYGT